VKPYVQRRVDDGDDGSWRHAGRIVLARLQLFVLLLVLLLVQRLEL
jgi:hypothetical protein